VQKDNTHEKMQVNKIQVDSIREGTALKVKISGLKERRKGTERSATRMGGWGPP
jgi:hypothetical protein